MTFEKARTLLLATALAVGGASYAMAQSSPAPANQSGGGTSATTPAPTDPGTAGATGNTKGQPAAGTGMRNTTGSGMSNSSMGSGRSATGAKRESMEKTKSPASQDSGVKQQK